MSSNSQKTILVTGGPALSAVTSAIGCCQPDNG